MEPAYTYSARVVRVIDADTFVLDIDLGLYVSVRERIRLAGCDAPEQHTDRGQYATLFVMQQMRVGSVVTIRTYKTNEEKRDKYGRWLADVYLASGHDLTQLLISEGLATPMKT